MRRRNLIGAIGLPIAGALVLAITLWPAQVDAAYGPELAWVLDILHGWGLSWRDGYRLLEFSANVAMFVPLGFLAGLLLSGRRVPLGALGLPLALVLASMAIEGAQLLFLPERVPSWLDVLANSLGGCIGVGLAELISRLVDRAARTQPDTAPRAAEMRRR